MKNYIKSLTASQLMIDIYLITVLVGLPLVVHKAYADIGDVKYYFYCGASILLIPVFLLNLGKGFSIQSFFRTLNIGEKALLIYWIVSALSTIFSPYRFEAFWGNEGRLSGFMLMSIYVISYFLITRYYKPFPIIMYACILSGIIVFTLGITDFFDLNLLHFKDNIVQKSYSDFTSTIGNINFYSSYGAVIIGLIVGIYTTCSSLLSTIICFFFMIVGFIGLIVGNSDNAYLTFSVLVAFLPLYLFRNRTGIRRYLMMISALLCSFWLVRIFSIHFADMVLELKGIPSIITRWNGFIYLCIAFWALTAIVYARDYQQHKQADTLGRKMQILWGIFLGIAALVVVAVLIDANLLGHSDRYSAIGNYVVFNNDWGTHRGYIWRKAMENYRDFPLLQKILGYGPETYGIVSYYENIAESAELYRSFFDNVHNEYLQFLVTIGPIATGAYIAFLVLSVWNMIKLHSSPYMIGSALAVMCYCGQAVVNINQAASTPIMWIILSMGIAEYRNTQ